MNSYQNWRQLIIGELDSALQEVEVEKLEKMISLIMSADKVFVVGVGRVLLMLKAFVKRLNHLGINAFFVGSINEPAITSRDILIVGSGSGESVIPVAISRVARNFNAQIIHIGSNPESSVGQYSDLFIRIPCQTKLKLKGEVKSRQAMSSLFEQCILIIGDITSAMIIEKKNIDLEPMWMKHANLE